MRGRLEPALRWARQGLLTVGAALGVGCILMTLGAAVFGLRPLVFQSGSMSPTIRTGDLAISHDVAASSLRVGDVVSVPTGTGSRVTHRIVSIDHEGSDAVLALRGDANEATDTTPYRVSRADRVVWRVPRLGYLVGWLSSPLGLFLLGLYAAFLVSVLVKGSPHTGPRTGSGGGDGRGEPLTAEARVVPPSPAVRPGRVRRRGQPGGKVMASSGLSVLLAAGALSGVACARAVAPTTAAWTDPGTVTGTTLTAYTVPAPPAGATCTALTQAKNKAQGVVYTWPTPAGSFQYTATTSPALSGSTSTFATSGTNTSLTVTYNGTIVANQAQTVSVTAQASPVSLPTWLSQPTTLGSFVTGAKPADDAVCA